MASFKKTKTFASGSGRIQSGENSGTVNVGLTFEQYKTSLEKALARKAVGVPRVQGAEFALLQREIDELTRRLSGASANYKERLAEMADVKAMLAVYENQIDKGKLLAACAALDRDDTWLAEALFTDLALKARQHRKDAASEKAKLLFELGKLAEAKVDWAEAAKQYGEAARLDPLFDHLNKVREFTFCIEAYAEALQ